MSAQAVNIMAINLVASNLSLTLWLHYYIILCMYVCVSVMQYITMATPSNCVLE